MQSGDASPRCRRGTSGVGHSEKTMAWQGRGEVRASSKHIMNCFQHIPESCGALHSTCGGAPQQRGPLTPQTQTRPNRLHIHTPPTHPPKRLAHPRSPIPPLSTLTSRATHAHPTLPRSTGFCAIWGCISSSSSSRGSGWGARRSELREWGRAQGSARARTSAECSEQAHVSATAWGEAAAALEAASSVG